MGLCSIKQDGSCLKLQEFAAYASSFKWNNSQGNIPLMAVKG
jgi:hypothetical protein